MNYGTNITKNWQINQYKKIDELLNKSLDNRVILIDNSTIEIIKKLDLKV